MFVDDTLVCIISSRWHDAFEWRLQRSTFNRYDFISFFCVIPEHLW